MYKDKNRQREANRKASQRRRDKGMTQGMTNEGMTVVDERPNEPSNVIPKTKCPLIDMIKAKPKRSYIGTVPEVPGVTTLAKHKGVTSEGVTDKALPVEAMIQDVADNGGEYSFKTVKGEVQDVHHTKPKRGKDIKCFVTCSGVVTARAGVVTGKPGDADYNGVCTPEQRKGAIC